MLEGERLGPSVDLAVVAERTEGYSGSDLKQLCIQAAMRPVRAFLEQDSAVAAAAPEHKGALAQPKAVQQGEGPASAAAEAPAAEQEAAAAAAAEVAAPADEAAAAAAGEVPPADAPPAAEPAEAVVRPPLAVVPRLDSLLRQAERIASVPRNPRRDLRPITMQVWGLCCAAVLESCCRHLAGRLAQPATGAPHLPQPPTALPPPACAPPSTRPPQDFEEAAREVGASVDPDSSVVQELNEWNSHYGTTGSKRGVAGKRLSYYS